MVLRSVPKLGQIAHKWDKSGTFSDQISVQRYSVFVQFVANLAHFVARSGIPDMQYVGLLYDLSRSNTR